METIDNNADHLFHFQHAEVSSPAPTVSWIDLLHPTNEERASVEASYGLSLPSREELSEVELSSRISEKNGVLFLSMPTVSHVGGLDQAPSPLGFVLSKNLLVSIRYTQLHSFDTVAAKYSKVDGHFSSVDTFAALVDEMVDLSADLIEKIAADLDGVSRAVFSKLGKQRQVTQSNEKLRGVLIGVGNAGERLSRIRDSVLGLQRIVPFVAGTEQDWIPANIRVRLRATQTDLSSLAEYETYLSDKVQFLLDAVLGFINTKQNDIFQVLTVISIVGIPPTLVASIYGMNFRNMPELSWAWGYPYALVLILLSAILPILWFKWRRWV
jgi:magnesium transporter